jgi:hypothetical protein
LNGEYENAIDFMSDHHRKHPWIGDYQHVILDALFALDKDEGDYNWVENPCEDQHLAKVQVVRKKGKNRKPL